MIRLSPAARKARVLERRQRGPNGIISLRLGYVLSTRSLDVEAGEKFLTRREFEQIQKDAQPNLGQLRRSLEAVLFGEDEREWPLDKMIFELCSRYRRLRETLNARDGREQTEGVRYRLRALLNGEAAGLAYSSDTQTLLTAVIGKIRRLERELRDARGDVK